MYLFGGLRPILLSCKRNQNFFGSPPKEVQMVLTEACLIDLDRFLFSSTVRITVSFKGLQGAKST